MTTDGGGWTLVYKYVAGPYAAGLRPRAADAWTGAPYNELEASVLTRAAGTADYASSLVQATSTGPNGWSQFDEARLEVIDNGGVAVYATFDAVESTSLDWFSPARYLHTRSTWQDIHTRSWTGVNSNDLNGVYFSIDTTTRHWYINNNWGGCSSDSGWLTATHYGDCAWESSAEVRILYSPTGLLLNSAMSQADLMLVWAR
jgi:hypothetical protein